MLGDKLDNQEIDFAVMHILEQFVKLNRRHKVFGADTFYARLELVKSNLFKALFDCNIIWKSKYFEIFQIEHHLYVQAIDDWMD